MNRSAKRDKQNLSLSVKDQFDLLHLILVVLFLEAGPRQELDQGALDFLHVKNSALLRINVRCVDDDSLESTCRERA